MYLHERKINHQHNIHKIHNFGVLNKDTNKGNHNYISPAHPFSRLVFGGKELEQGGASSVYTFPTTCPRGKV